MVAMALAEGFLDMHKVGVFPYARNLSIADLEQNKVFVLVDLRRMPGTMTADGKTPPMVQATFGAIALPSIANTAIAAERHISRKLSEAMFIVILTKQSR
ncbi:hypothetical protein [Rhizobium laguerreae]|nr:hypothetical protein [Rhizobium laguerreae]MBY3252358.1 hypothetical protein [Rhizobium laguerreae]